MSSRRGIRLRPAVAGLWPRSRIARWSRSSALHIRVRHRRHRRNHRSGARLPAKAPGSGNVDAQGWPSNSRTVSFSRPDLRHPSRALGNSAIAPSYGTTRCTALVGGTSELGDCAVDGGERTSPCPAVDAWSRPIGITVAATPATKLSAPTPTSRRSVPASAEPSAHPALRLLYHWRRIS